MLKAILIALVSAAIYDAIKHFLLFIKGKVSKTLKKNDKIHNINLLYCISSTVFIFVILYTFVKYHNVNNELMIIIALIMSMYDITMLCFTFLLKNYYQIKKKSKSKSTQNNLKDL